jgi:signal transduction histidine kinase
MFTSLSSLPQIVGALRLGADDYITKPFQNEELLARVEASVRTARMKIQLVEARQSAEDALSKLRIAQDQLLVEEKITSVARLSAGVAHSINNPLGFIISNLASLERYSSSILNHTDDLKQRLQSYGREECDLIDDMEKKHRIRQIRGDLKPLIDETREGFERIALIVKRLSRLELGLSQQLQSSPFDLIPSMEALTLSLPSSNASNISLVWKSGVAELQVMGPLLLLNVAIEELVTNAVESIRETGVVTVTADRSGDEGIITICDTGEGIPEMKLQEIFEPFYTSRDQQSHVGLGLTIAERFLDLIGGKIRIVSEVGVGSTVSVHLPLVK